LLKRRRAFPAALRLLCARAALLAACAQGLARSAMNAPETPRRNLTGAMIPALGVAGLAAVCALLLVGTNHGKQAIITPAPQDCILEGADAVGGPISLLDSNGAHITQADFVGQPAVVYFGFTHCPDACPTTMYSLTEALAAPGGYDVTPVLITVDPERDTPDVMRAYTHTQGFPAGLVGLTGSAAQVDGAKQAFRVYASRSPIEGAPANVYNVDHSSFLYVMDRHWRTVAITPTMKRERPEDPTSTQVAVPPAELAACIAAGLDRAAAAS